MRWATSLANHENPSLKSTSRLSQTQLWTPGVHSCVKIHVMAMRNVPLVEKEFYHIYNRGVDKRNILIDIDDLNRFLKGMVEFNVIKPIGSIYENRKRKRGRQASTIQKPLVNFIAYAINQNHFHFILEQIAERGIEKFMHRLGTGHSKYFNSKHKRSGALFQGKFKAKLIDSNEYLLHLSAYINLNDKAHNRGRQASTLGKTSWNEYVKENYTDSLCKKEMILGQFKNRRKYQEFAESSLKSIVEKKILFEELEADGIELIHR